MKDSITLATRKLPTVLIAAALALVFACGFSGQAQASQDGGPLVAGSTAVSAQDDENSTAPELQPATFWAGNDDGDYVGNYVTSNSEVESVVTIKSSNPKVLKINRHGTSSDLWSYSIKPIKAGKVRITVTYKIDGTTKTTSNTFTVKKFPNPIKAMTVNGKKVPVPTAKNFTDWQRVYCFKGKSAKVKVTPAKGWKLSGKLCAIITDKDVYDGYDYQKLFANGTAFKFGKSKNASVEFTLVRKNSDGTSDSFAYGIPIVREKPVDFRKGNGSANRVYVGYPYTAKKSSYAMFYTCNPKAKITKVTSSNPKVLTAKCGKSATSLKLTGKKPGKSTVTLQYTYKGKKYTTKNTYIVDKPPIASLLVNGKKVKLTDVNGYDLRKYKKSGITLKLVPTKGWKVASVEYYDDAGEESQNVKNGAKLAVSKAGQYYWNVTLKNNKTKKTFYYAVGIDRN